MGLVLSVVVSLLLARRMVTPIRALQAGTARIGAGGLQQRIEVHTGDELEDLADGFNRMSAQLADSYATLEQKVMARTRDLAAVTRTADLLVVAIGRAGFIGREHIKPGATVIDVGMNRVSDVDEVRSLFGAEAEKRLEVVAKRGSTLVGDVNPSQAAEVAGMLTPVPGGVGLLTVAMLMKNTLRAAKLRKE